MLPITGSWYEYFECGVEIRCVGVDVAIGGFCEVGVFLARFSGVDCGMVSRQGSSLSPPPLSV